MSDVAPTCRSHLENWADLVARMAAVHLDYCQPLSRNKRDRGLIGA